MMALHTNPIQSFSLLLLVLFVPACFGCDRPLHAEPTTLKVKVYKKDGEEAQTVEGIGCGIMRIGAHKLKKRKTDKNGEIVFKDITQGKYMVHFGSSIEKCGLPGTRGPITVKEGQNVFKISCKNTTKVKGTVNYMKGFDLSSSYVKSNNSQFDVQPNKEGEFTLHGLVSNTRTRLRFTLLPTSFNNEVFFPVYKRIVNMKADRMKPDKVIDIGEVTFPKAKKTEFVRVYLLDKEGKEPIKGARLKGLSHTLLIENKNSTIFLEGFSTLLVKNMSGEDGAKFRLPEGEYTAWWRGYKENTSTSFRITQEKTPKIKMRLPDEQE